MSLLTQDEKDQYEKAHAEFLLAVEKYKASLQDIGYKHPKSIIKTQVDLALKD